MNARACVYFLHAVSVLVAAASFAWALQIQEARQTPDSTIRVRSQEVLVDVVVTDGNGRPVPTLQASDFEVYEDGVRQPIKAFRFESRRGAAPGIAPSPSETLQRPVPATSPRPGLVSLVFDTTSTGRDGALLARRAAMDYVKSFMGPEDHAAVFGTGIGLYIFQPFTRDRESLLKAIEQVTSGDTQRFGAISGEIRMQLETVIGRGWSDAEKIASAYEDLSISPSAGSVQREERMDETGETGRESTINSFAYAALRTLLVFRQYEREFQGRMNFSGLMAILEAQRIFSGRKALIYFSGGFAVTSSAAAQFRSVIGAANRANVTIYSVDTAGLRLEDPNTPSNLEIDSVIANRVRGRGADRVIGGQSLLDRIEQTARLNSVNNLEELSTDTGGYTIKNTNDLQEGLRRISGDMKEYYILTYSPTNTKYDGKFRKISVRVPGRTGLVVRARAGYYAFHSRDNMPILSYEPPLLEGLNSAEPPADFPLATAAYRFGGEKEAREAIVIAAFPMSAVTVQEDKIRKLYQSQVDTLMLLRDSEGNIQRKLSREYSLEGPLDELKSALKRNLTFFRNLRLAPGGYTLETVVRDRPSGRTAVKKTSFRLEPAAPGVLQLSSVILSKTAAPLGDLRVDAEQNPFVVEESATIVPDLERVYRKSADSLLIVYFNVFTSPQVSSSVAGKLEFIREDGTVIRAEGVLPLPGRDGRIQYVTSFELANFLPGEYALRVTVQAGKSSATELSDFRVIP